MSARAWHGRCSVEDDPRVEWTDCQVVDISLIGAGIDVWSDCPPDLQGSRLVVEVRPPRGGSVLVRFSGVVTRVTRESAFHSRVGLEFADLSTAEETVLTLLDQMHRAPARR